MDNEKFAQDIDALIVEAEKAFRNALWATEQAREVWIQLKVQKSNLYLAGFGAKPR